MKNLTARISYSSSQKIAVFEFLLNATLLTSEQALNLFEVTCASETTDLWAYRWVNRKTNPDIEILTNYGSKSLVTADTYTVTAPVDQPRRLLAWLPPCIIRALLRANPKVVVDNSKLVSCSEMVLE